MNKHVILTLALTVTCTIAYGIEDMRTEHLSSPIGIDNPAPRFSWKSGDINQNSYRITVKNADSTIWDSGTVKSSDVLVTYAGPTLTPFTSYSWKVELTDNDGNVTESETARFESGMLNSTNWKGAWISDSKSPDSRPAPRFRREFKLGGEIVKARAYIAVGGLYSLFVNGLAIEPGRILDPAFTRYDRRILYASYDITEQLHQGINAVGVELGNGWYNHQSATTWHFDRATWRARPTFCMDIRVSYSDGSEDVICTDARWTSSADGPVRFNNIYVGEHHDLRSCQTGWAEPGYDASLWNGVTLRSCPAAEITSQAMDPIRESSPIRAARIDTLRPSKWVYDFGVNMAGNVRFRARGNRGTIITLKYAERLNVEGRADQSNINPYYFGDNAAEPFQTDIVTLSGADDDFHPCYSYKGFRYVEVSASGPVELDLYAVRVNSDVRQTGRISCSTPIITEIWEAARRSYLSNLEGIPTDCPQREKNGWTGDAHIAIETGLFNYDTFTVYEKWMADHRDEQQPNGVLPDIIPTCGWGYWAPESDGNGLDWTSTIAIIPWELYLFTGDPKPLKDCYDNIRRYVDYALSLRQDGLVCWGRGDWVPVSKKSDKTLICSCFLYNDLKILACAAEMSGHIKDAGKYAAVAQELRNRINTRFLDRETGVYADGMQTSQSLPLYFGITEDDDVPAVAEALALCVRRNGCHINAGVHGAKAVLHALSENGYGDLAYNIVTRTDFPSWGYWLAGGNTTLVENWRLDAGKDNSDNHIMFGDIAAWFYRSFGGINPDPANPGFKHIILKPICPKGMKDFCCTYESPYGRIRSGWLRKGGKVIYTVSVPCGSSATLVFKDGRREEIPAGEHKFILD